MVWWDLAACVDEDPEMFFPVGTAGHALVVQVAAAKAVCRRCPVKARCLDWGLRSGHEAGVWGGTSEEERRAMRGTAPWLAVRR
jgi:WhiB family redox-sensing transcriptional regulator